MSQYMASKKTMELNPSHQIIKALKAKFEDDASDKNAKDLVFLLYDTALLTSGFTLDNPISFSTRIHKLIKLGLSIEDDEEDDDEEVPEDDDDDIPQLENEDASAMEDV